MKKWFFGLLYKLPLAKIFMAFVMNWGEVNGQEVDAERAGFPAGCGQSFGWRLFVETVWGTGYRWRREEP